MATEGHTRIFPVVILNNDNGVISGETRALWHKLYAEQGTDFLWTDPNHIPQIPSRILCPGCGEVEYDTYYDICSSETCDYPY